MMSLTACVLIFLSAISCTATGANLPLSRSSKAVVSEINPGNGLPRGDWGPVDLCPANSYARMFALKYAQPGALDDTLANGVLLYCYDTSGNLITTINSDEATYGEYQTPRQCPNSERLVGFSMQVLEDQGSLHDDTAVENIQMVCEGGTVLDGLYGFSSYMKLNKIKVNVIQNPRINPEKSQEIDSTGNGIQPVINGQWGMFANCPAGTAICGLQTMIERDSTATDDAGLCDINMFCCD